MTEDHTYLTLPSEDLPDRSKVALKILPDLDDLYRYFARQIADEIKDNNQAGLPTRLILPVGPVGQYPVLAEICNQEGISWKDVFTFNMDEYCDWQGRVVLEDHPLSFRGFMQREFFDRLDAQLRIPQDQVFFPQVMPVLHPSGSIGSRHADGKSHYQTHLDNAGCHPNLLQKYAGW